MIPAIVATEIGVRNPVTVVSAALLPGTVLGFPTGGAMLLPGARLLDLLCLLLLRRPL